MARVFVSHSSRDSRLADQVRQRLLNADHEVFLDCSVEHGLQVGDEWEQRLHHQLRRADAVACLVTAAFVASTWCSGEVAIARALGCRLLPIMAQPGVEHPFLSSIQHVDLRDGELAWTRLAAALRRVDAAGGSGWADDRSPFPGLRPFEIEHHRVFFGRRTEANRLAALLRSPAERADAAVLLVVGPSGCGKSSLVRAGLLPVMADDDSWWTLTPMLPGSDPVAAMVRVLAAAARAVGLDTTIAELRARLDASGLAPVADELLHHAPGPRRTRLLMVIDQLEELLMQSSRTQRARFARCSGRHYTILCRWWPPCVPSSWTGC